MAFFLASTNGLKACSVPVYYYALLQWPSGLHAVGLGKISKEINTSSISDHLSNSSANVKMDSAPNAIALDHVQIRFPNSDKPWWDEEAPSNDFNKSLDLLIDSPVRQEMVRQIMSGVSAVWILLESGDKKADEAAFRRLTSRLQYLQKVTELPPQVDGENGETNLDRAHIPLKVAFSVLRVSRTNPQEVGLVEQLLHLNADIHSVKEPMAFAVFGRARALSPLYGKDLTDAEIDNIALFLVGSCSCQVKDLNPGTDLLVKADWEELLDATLVSPTDAKANVKRATELQPDEHITQPKKS